MLGRARFRWGKQAAGWIRRRYSSEAPKSPFWGVAFGAGSVLLLGWAPRLHRKLRKMVSGILVSKLMDILEHEMI